jgi:hypothetical protein
MQTPLAHGSLTKRASVPSRALTAWRLYFEGVPSARRLRPKPLHSRGLRPLATAVALAAVSVGLAACGSSYTKQNFVDRANGICTDALAQTRAIAPTGAPESNRALAAYLRRVLPIVQQEASQLRALRRPPGSDADNAALDRYLSALDGEVAATKRLRDAAARGDGDGVSAAENDLQSSEAASLAARYGLKSCASPGSTAA